MPPLPVAALALLLAGCGSSDDPADSETGTADTGVADTGPGEDTDPADTGIQIGHYTTTWIDASRSDREVDVEVYYPAVQEGEDAALYTPPEGGYPVVAFAHGRTMPHTAYESYWEALVPEGYVVAMPTTEMEVSPSKYHLGVDLVVAIEGLQAAGAESGSIFEGGIAETSAVLGHSLGGVASLLAAWDDPSAVTANASFSTGYSEGVSLEEITTPAFVFAGTDDELTPVEDFQEPMYEGLASDCKLMLVMEGASHCQYADYSDECDGEEGANDDPGLERDEQLARTFEMVTPWLDAWLKGEDDPWNTLLQHAEDGTYGEWQLACEEGP